MYKIVNSPTDKNQKSIEQIYRDIEKRIAVNSAGACPVDFTAAFLKLCQCQTCGKCVPCRIGLKQLEIMLDDILEGRGTPDTIKLIEKTAEAITDSADCALGYEAASMVKKNIVNFREDYELHILSGGCTGNHKGAIPCTAYCPAGVDVPGYIALVAEARYDDAIRLIRQDNPMPLTCALVCEHPCEKKCRRNTVDYSINIKGLKRTAVENAGDVPIPERCPDTEKHVAIIGGGPSGITAAYYLSLMGHGVTIFEQRKKLGGMLQYGIPNYRLPKNALAHEIETILSNGVTVKTGISVGRDISLEEIKNSFDAIYLAIGAHGDMKLNIPGEDAVNVVSAVELLRAIGDGEKADFIGKSVLVIGGGNVAMDAARTAIRLGATETKIIYRRRKNDMTALPEEVEGAASEGCQLLELMAPVRVEKDSENKVTGLWVKPQIIGPIEKGRPKPLSSNSPDKLIPCDIIVVAIGQSIESDYFKSRGIPVTRGSIGALASGEISNMPGFFAGGDCVTGPATVIKAIAAGKAIAANIDNYLGFKHQIRSKIKIPATNFNCISDPYGRVNLSEREAQDRIKDFDEIEIAFTADEAKQEASRCLRCDHFGYSVFKGGRLTR